MTVSREGPVVAHLRVRVAPEQRSALRALAKQRHSSMSQLLRTTIARELESVSSGILPDESAIREMAILVAVELVLKLQEATIPGGITRSRQLLESAARAAIARIETVEASLTRQAGR
ncbi:MAG: hypothetical protein ACYC9D_12705 [Candidatus Dormibacteria bacterium]